jgi:urease accessory protein
MGKEATRITAQDFVTPLELADYRLALEGAGRIGGVRLEIAEGGLAGAYQQVPLRVVPLHIGPTEPLLVYLLNPTAGLLDGDAQLIDIEAGPGSRAFITGQSASRLHPCLQGFSTQQWRVRARPGAIVLILPGPAIPFQGCRFYQRVTVDLDDGAHLIWGDIWLAGRYARAELSERFRFHTLVQDFTVYRQSRAVFRDRFCWRGPWDEGAATWYFGSANAFGSLFSTVPAQVAAPTADATVRQAVFQTAHGHRCYRYLGPVQAVTAALCKMAFGLAAAAEGRSDSWLQSAGTLAPNHWFAGQE